MRWGDTSGPAGDAVFTSGGLWQLVRAGERLRFDLVSPSFGAYPYVSATLATDFRTGEVVVHPGLAASGAPFYALQYPLDELLFTNLLARGRGIELHGCGLVDEAGNGLLFVGHSGAGKSTTAGLWVQEPGVRILSDDRIIVRLIDGELRMYGTPWHGEARHSLPEHAVLRRILVLEHGQSNHLERLPRGAAASALMSRSFVPHYSAPGLEFSLAFVAQVVELVPCEVLRFVPGPEAVELVRRSHPWLP
ncbi:MAG: hypothetical protein AB2L07_20180 [Thermoanaerobaculaceae bacterium]